MAADAIQVHHSGKKIAELTDPGYFLSMSAAPQLLLLGLTYMFAPRISPGIFFSA